MRIGRLEKHQRDSDAPLRRVSKSRADKFIVRKIAKWIIFGKLLKMLKDDSEIRGDIELFQASIPIIERPKRKRWNRNLLLHYPHKSQESKGMVSRFSA